MAIAKHRNDDPEQWRRLAEANRETRETNPQHYGFHAFDGQPKFYWDEIEVSAEEFRANGEPWQLERLAQALGT